MLIDCNIQNHQLIFDWLYECLDSAEIWVLSAKNVTNFTAIQFSPPRVMFKHKGTSNNNPNSLCVNIDEFWELYLYSIVYAVTLWR